MATHRAYFVITAAIGGLLAATPAIAHGTPGETPPISAHGDMPPPPPPPPPGEWYGDDAMPFADMPPVAYAPPFDRGAWLATCRERIRGVRSGDRAAVISGLLGAALGGFIGNRVADGDRLAGTVVGAGAGGLAGAAVGSAIEADRRRSHADECAAALDQHHPRGEYVHGYGHGYPAMAYAQGHGYGCAPCGYQVAMVPVMIAVPQRAVVRETVIEEIYDEPVRSRTIIRTTPSARAVRQTAPAPRQRTKLIKGN